jgi:hypothetical protein
MPSGLQGGEPSAKGDLALQRSERVHDDNTLQNRVHSYRQSEYGTACAFAMFGLVVSNSIGMWRDQKGEGWAGSNL